MMKQQEIKQKITELEQKIEKGIETCEIWLDSKDGSYGMCLDHNGVLRAREEIKELKNELGA